MFTHLSKQDSVNKVKRKKKFKDPLFSILGNAS
jgi:hypothetical protein